MEGGGGRGAQGGSEAVRQLLEAKQWGPPPQVKGSQDFGPAPEENAPVGKPITKHTAHLQVLPSTSNTLPRPPPFLLEIPADSSG